MRNLLAVALGAMLFLGTSSVSAQTTEPVVITMWEPGGLQPSSIESVSQLVEAAGGEWVVHHTGTLRLSAVTRDGVDVQRAPEGFHYPMATLALDPEASRPLIGAQAAGVLEQGMVVMGATSARLRGAQAGDVVTFVGWDEQIHDATIGLVSDNTSFEAAELVFSVETAESFAFSRASSMRLWDLPEPDRTRGELLAALSDRRVGIALSTDRPNPDFVSSSADLKARFGEFAYRETGRGDQIEIEPAWVEANIVTVDLPILGEFKCHRMVVPYLEAAVDDIIRGGLASQIDPVDFQTAGGCYNPRLIRGGDKGGAVSRHAWGVAVDLNPSTNRYGGAITLDRQVAEIFHYWGFAWGGGWVFTDGGHFEWKQLPAHKRGAFLFTWLAGAANLCTQ